MNISYKTYIKLQHLFKWVMNSRANRPHEVDEQQNWLPSNEWYKDTNGRFMQHLQDEDTEIYNIPRFRLRLIEYYGSYKITINK